MRKLGANVVRVHLQFGTYMTGPDEFDRAQLDRLREMLDLGRELGLYLDVTGLSLYRLDRIPAWYDALDEAERWEVQARWWEAIAGTCADHPAVFCYDLMNEPVVPGGARNPGDWLGPPFMGGDTGYFVQFITLDQKVRPRPAIARQWCHRLVTAIRKHDRFEDTAMYAVLAREWG